MFLSLRSVHASDEFVTSYDVTYDVMEIGEVHIGQKISITNKSNDVIATDYSISIKQMNIFDVSGNDSEGPLGIDVQKINDFTKISTKFNEQVIGKDRSLNWNLNYKSKGIASKVGEVWHINIPKNESLDETNRYVVTLNVPSSLGPNIFISPTPDQKIEQNNKTTYVFNKQTLLEQGIIASFGTYQVVNFQLKYALDNPSVLTSYKQIALPPDIPGVQQVFYRDLDPLPQKVKRDVDGNIIATYKLKPNTQEIITLTGSTKISGRQINPEFGGNIKTLPKDLVKQYTKKDTYWDSSHVAIVDVATTLFNPDLTTSQNARAAYDYVVQSLNYNFDLTNQNHVGRRGGFDALISAGSVGCMEFTDLFVSIVRAMGIPAREINGYALTNEPSLTPLSISLKGGDLLHSWAEYYDPNFGWVQVDPTWGSTSGIDYFTKLDTDHFAFVTKGTSSIYPHPAGAYKIAGDEKQVQVEVAQNAQDVSFIPTLHLYKTIRRNRYVAFNRSGSVMYGFNGGKETLLPFSTINIYLNTQKTDKVFYKDFNGTLQSTSYEIVQGKPPESIGITPVVLSVVSALVLCGLIYYFAISQKARQKLRRLLALLRRDQDLPPNQS